MGRISLSALSSSVDTRKSGKKNWKGGEKGTC